jgi:hypothetical protein
MLVPPFVKENKEIIAAVVGGTLAIIAAYIRRDKRPVKAKKRPIQRALVLCLLSLVLGAACLAAEARFFPINPEDDLNTDNFGEILCLAGCLFLAAGVIWGFVNLVRLLLWRKPVPEEVPVEAAEGPVL